MEAIVIEQAGNVILIATPDEIELAMRCLGTGGTLEYFTGPQVIAISRMRSKLCRLLKPKPVKAKAFKGI